MTCAPEKCLFRAREFTFLGHNVKEGCLIPKQQHQLKIENHPKPATRKQLRSFLGVCNWLREYVNNYARITTPLTRLISNKVPFRWTDECDTAFQTLQAELSKPKALWRPDMAVKFHVQTDASHEGLGAVLFQEVDGERRVVAYSSSTLKPAEKNYHSNELPRNHLGGETI